MDYVARAKLLLAGKARTGALLVLPLAAAVQQANAVVAVQPTLPTAGFSCTTNANSGSCTGAGVQPDVGTGITGDGFFANSPNFFNGSSYNSFIDFSTSGSMTGPSGGGLLAGSTIGEAYGFTINNSGGFNGGTWDLFYQIIDQSASGAVVLSDSSHSGSGSGTFSGSFTDQLTGPINVGDNLQITVDLNLHTNGSGGAYLVTIPGGETLDIGTSATGPAAPEPSTLSFGALALAIAGVWHRLRRKKTADLQ